VAHPKRATIKANDGREVEVHRANDHAVVVRWACGATREFTPAGLRQAVDNFELVQSYNGGTVWMEDQDHQGSRFACRLVGDRFHADDSISREQYNVPWSTFKRALLARAKDA